MDKAGDGSGGGGSGTGTDDKNKPDPKDQEIADLKAKLAKLETPNPKPKDDDLLKKARDLRDKEDKSKGDEKALESALRFSMGADQFMKNNATLLPKDAADIFKAAEAEKYDSQIEKASAIKAGLIQSFFQVQSNVDMLTASQKTVLEDYLKLTKNGKQDKAQQIYDSIFEPTIELMRKLKRAEALSKGHGSSSDTEDAYKQKLMNLSRKHYLGEKN
jgi:hypothetical protein